MSELQQALLISALTVCSSVTVLVTGQIIIKFLLDPLTELRKLLGEISDSLTFYANVYANPGQISEEITVEAMRDLRQRSSQLWARALALPLYSLFRFLRLVPSKKQISEASSNLIGLSNSLGSGGDPKTNTEAAVAIREALGLRKE